MYSSKTRHMFANAASWQREFRSDGIYDVSVRAISGRFASSGAECRIVVGPGTQVDAKDLLLTFVS